ncbi:MAG: endonuclease domain-containing protein [Myxococcota bacterium]
MQQSLRPYARELRQSQTSAELWLWKMVRAHRFAGFKFRRQVPIGPFIVDFYCAAKRLVIELDGGQHNAEPALIYDLRRTAFLKSKGLVVLRFWNNEVLGQRESVLQKIWEVLHEKSPSPHPSQGKIPSPTL